MYTVYVIKSKVRNYIYVGLTSNFSQRLDCHNLGKNKTTRAYAPFDIITIEKYPTRIEARKREKYLKSGVGKEYIKKSLPR
jgi:putative endonuclease